VALFPIAELPNTNQLIIIKTLVHTFKIAMIKKKRSGRRRR
jgi:hypothetical protein